MRVLPVSAIVPTRNRPGALARTLGSLSLQGIVPAELIVIDGSADGASKRVIDAFATQCPECSFIWRPALHLGAAVQRNQGVACASQDFLWFFDDDITFEPKCVVRLWQAVGADARLGGVSAMISNQRYNPPGTVSRILFSLLNGRRDGSFAGRVIGPAVNLLPEDRDDLPEVVSVEWLNLGCTLYRREALPSPPFDSIFAGYSLMEDLTLSLRVGRLWKLANVRTARIVHDSQPGPHKADVCAMAAMELVNRHYVMTQILERNRVSDYLRLFVWESFQLGVSAARADSRAAIREILRGKWEGLRKLRLSSASGK